MSSRVATGVEALDHILGGGLPASRFHLVQGDPGVGKTTLGLQFLLAGVKAGERVLYVTLSETREELLGVAESHGWSLDGIDVFELAGNVERVLIDEQNTLFEPAEVELNEVTRALMARVEEVHPTRVVFDSLSELRLLAQSALRYRRQLLALKQRFSARGMTVLMMDDRTSEPGDTQLQSIAHGVILLEQLSPIYGAERRRLRIAKMRGVEYRGGYHDFRIERGGLRIFERLVASEHHEAFVKGQVPSGNVELDTVVGGGLDRGTSVLLLGPAGSGKSAIAVQYACAAAKRGEKAVIYAFDEGLQTLLGRSDAMGMDATALVKQGNLRIFQIDPAEMSPGELVTHIRTQVEEDEARIVVIDSLNGYLAAMPEEQFLIVQMHELVSYLRQRGVLALLIVSQAGLIGTMQSVVDVSYLADSVIVTRFFEAKGRVHKALAVLKRRAGLHDPGIRELRLDATGVHVGDNLTELQGVFTGVPELVGGFK